MNTAIILFHICCATLGLLSGYLAMFLRKGSGLHGAAGTVFFLTMVGMGLSGAYYATFVHPIMINVVAGLLTFYLVVTARRAAKRRDGTVGMFDRVAVVFVLTIGVLAMAYGFFIAQTGPRNGVPSVAYFIFGTGALLAVVSDIRMLRRGELAGPYRIRRHLWRMSTALLIATFSLYPGQGRLFPQWLRDSNLLFVPHVLLFGSMLFWMARIRVRKNKQRKQAEAVHVSELASGIAA